MAVTNQQIIDYLLANPNLSDAQIVSAMEKNGISPAQMASAVGLPEGQIAARVAATIPQGQSIQLGDTIVQPQYQVTGSGENQQIGGLENVITYKADENKVGGNVVQYSPTGEYQQTTQQQKVDTSLGGAIKDIASNPLLKAAALAYGANAAGLFGGGGLLAGAEGVPLSELMPGASNLAPALNVADVVAPSALSAPAATAFDLANAGIAGGTASFTPAQLAAIDAASGVTGGAGLLTQAPLTNPLTGVPAVTSTTGLLTPAATTATGALTAEELAKKAATSAVVNELAKKTADTASGLLQTGGSLLQSQVSKEAAQKAAQDTLKATQTAQEAAQFRPVGMTTRFGTSNYTYDPVTGRMISAGYQLSPEAKAAQDRLVGLAGRGLTQAEQAQAQFAPLQQGAQNLFNLGNQYISQSPQDVAQKYLNQQMALLQPGREVELANLQNRLQQQGRAGLSVAQGGTMGATTPELQALYNARAQQEAQLAANAQQYGQQNTLFGVNLLGQGANAMGNYYGGQAAAYQPYTTALGQIQGLETAAQQPLTMGANLAQQASAAGARSGALGLEGTNIANKFLTGNDATFNPYASVLTAAGNPNSMFGQSVAKYLAGTAATPYDALSSAKYGDGLAGYQKMIEDIYGT